MSKIHRVHDKRMAKVAFKPWTIGRITGSPRDILIDRLWELDQLHNRVTEEINVIVKKLAETRQQIAPKE